MADIATLQINIGASADDAIKEINKVQKTLQNLRGRQATAKINVDSKEVDKAAQKVSALSNVLNSLKRIAFYRVIRTAIKAITQAFKEGAENAYFFSQAVGSDLAPALDALSSASFTMKNQLGAAFATLLQTIQPVLLQIISLITKVAEAVTQLFAMFGGKSTYMKAADYATKYATAANKGAKATKEWKNQLMGFDEINRLEEPADTGGGGGGGVIPDYGAMFTEAPLTRWFTELRDITLDWWKTIDLEPITQAWYRLKDAVSDFVSIVDNALYWAYVNVLLPLGKWTIEKYAPVAIENLAKAFELLNQVLRKLAPWFKSVYETVIKPFAKFLADKLIQAMKDWGDTLEDLKNKVEAANTFGEFIQSLDGKEALILGIANALLAVGAAIKTWSLLKTAFNVLSGIVSFITSPVGIALAAVTALTFGIIWLYKNSETAREKIDEMITSVKEFTKKIGEYFKQFEGLSFTESITKVFTDLGDAIKGVDWLGVGRSIWNKLKLAFSWAISQLKEYIKSIDWASIATSLWSFLGSALGAALTTLEGFLEGIGADICTALKNAIDTDQSGEITLKEAGTYLIKTIFNGIKDYFALTGSITSWIYDNIISPFCDGMITAMGFSSGEDIYNAVKKFLWDDGIKAFVDDAAQLINELGLATLGEDIWNGITSGISSAVSKVWVWIVDNIWKPFINGFKMAFGIHSPAEKMEPYGELIWKGVLEGIISAIRGIGTWVEENIWAPLVDAIKAVFGISSEGGQSESAKSIGNSFIEGIKGGITNGIESLSELFSSLTLSWEEVKEKLNVEALEERFETAKNNISSTIDTIKQFFADLWTEAENTVRGIVNAMIGMINSVINAVNEFGHIQTEGLSILGREIIPAFDVQLFMIPNIATFAKGGFPEDGLFMANHGEMVGQFSNGKTAVANNEQIVEGVSRGVYEAVITAMSQASGGNSSNQPVNIYLDGRIIAQSSTKYQRQFAKAGIA